LKGSLRIINSGEGYAETVQVNFFLSDDMNLSIEDIPIGQGRKITNLKAGKRKTMKFSWDSTQNPSGKYILAVIDPEGMNLERSKTDNVVPQIIP
jgi:subtilase family serine protease